jgi:hypothetical protein
MLAGVGSHEERRCWEGGWFRVIRCRCVVAHSRVGSAEGDVMCARAAGHWGSGPSRNHGAITRAWIVRVPAIGDEDVSDRIPILAWGP